MVDGYDNKNFLWDPSPFKNFNPNYGAPVSPPRKKRFFYKGPIKKRKKMPTTRKKRKVDETREAKRKAPDVEEPTPATNSWLLFLKNLSENVDEERAPVKSRKVSLGSPQPTKIHPKKGPQFTKIISKKSSSQNSKVHTTGDKSTSEEEF
jgi:hypothetical protein